MAGWNDERKWSKVPKVPKVSEAPDVPLWLQWALALVALGLGAWFGWMMF